MQTFLPILSFILSISTLLSVFIVIALLVAKTKYGEGADADMHEFEFVIRHSKKAIVINLYMIMMGGIFALYNLFFPSSGVVFTLIIVVVALEAFYLTYQTLTASLFKITVRRNVFICKSFLKREFDFTTNDIKRVDVHYDTLSQLRHIDLHSETGKLVSIFPEKIDHSGYALLVSRLKGLEIKGKNLLPDESKQVQALGLGVVGIGNMGILMFTVQWAVLLLAALPHVVFDLEFFNAAFISVSIIIISNMIVLQVLKKADKLSKLHIANVFFDLGLAAAALAWIYIRGGY